MRRGTLSPWLFIAFPMAILLVFSLLPTLGGLALAFGDWRGSGPPRWVGPANFTDLLDDPRFLPALANTLVFVAASVPASVLIAFALAVIVDAPWFRGRSLVRACIFIPTVVSIVAVGIVWRWLLADQGGLVPAAVRFAGIQPPNFVQDGRWPLVCIIAAQVWRQAGFCFVLYMAALAGVNRSLYEAAAVDGAAGWSVTRHVTWAQVAPMTLFLLVTGVIGALQVFDIVWAMTLGAETDATRVLNLNLYREFQESRYGYASAIGAVIFLLTAAATAGQMLLARRRA